MENSKIVLGEKSLIVYTDVYNITKMADNGNIYRDTLKEKPDLGFEYKEIQFTLQGENDVKNKEYLSGKEGEGWEILNDEQIEAIIKFIDTYEIPADFYPTHWSNVIRVLHGSLNRYLDKTLSHVIDLAEDGTPIPENIRENRKFIKKYVPMLESEDIKDEVSFNNVLIVLKNAPDEVIENTTRCIKQSISEYDLKSTLDAIVHHSDKGLPVNE